MEDDIEEEVKVAPPTRFPAKKREMSIEKPIEVQKPEPEKLSRKIPRPPPKEFNF